VKKSWSRGRNDFEREMFLLLSFSAATLSIAALGLYGVVSYLVAQRTNEIGIRLALGAHPGDVAKMILRHGALLVAGGVAIGIPLAMALGQLVRSLLFGVQPADWFSFAGAFSLIALVTLMACWIPARRAMRVDPMVALRYE
jgi:putative ABC transport system permease protein